MSSGCNKPINNEVVVCVYIWVDSVLFISSFSVDMSH